MTSFKYALNITSFSVIVKTVENRFAPQPSIILARASSSLNLIQTENTEEYVTPLLGLASKLTYLDTVVQDMIWDRLSVLSSKEEIREKRFLELDSLALEQTLTLSTNIDSLNAKQTFPVSKLGHNN